MRHLVLPAVVILALTGTSAWVFRGALTGGQFGYRDAAHHYYPLYQRVQQEWSAGRVPLWDPWENGGQPLLGNPTAAVFYPGKLVYMAMPYPIAARAYVMLHVAIAFASMVCLLRGLGISGVGTAIGSLSYAFGAPVLFQYSNVIYLVGAAWFPLGLRCLLDWVRSTNIRSMAGLAAVLAMEVLGGDPQSAYLTGVLGVGIAAAWGENERFNRFIGLGWRGILGILFGASFLGILASAFLPSWRRAVEGLPDWWPSGRSIWAAIFVAVGLWLFKKAGSGRRRRILGVVLAGGLGLGLAAAQVGPIAEFAIGSQRGAAGRGLDAYGFSLAPYRVAELIWPNVGGLTFPQNLAWSRALPPIKDHTFWTPSLYLGGLTLALAIGGLTTLRDPSRRGWLAALVAVGLLGAFGRFAGPIGIAEWFPPWESVAKPLRGDDFSDLFEAEADSREGDGSPYWWLAVLLPGFDLFRYPSKLLTLSTLGLAALAGVGWDRVVAGNRRRTLVVAGVALVVGLVLLASVHWAQDRLVQAFGSTNLGSLEAGPLQAAEAVAGLERSLVHGSIVFGLTIGVLMLASRQKALAGGLALGLLAVDLAIANAPLVWTIPQATFEAQPAALAAIREAEARNPAGGPFRVHRMPVWHPFDLFRYSDPNRLEELTAWERDTLQPLHGLPLGISYPLTLGILENQDYLRAFLPEPRPVGPALGRVIGQSADRDLLFYPRRAFDAWNTRYFLLPVDPRDWRTDENRAYAAFVEGVEPIAPRLDGFESEAAKTAWRLGRDWQLFRNNAAMPRAWVVHEAQVVPRFDDLDNRNQNARLRTLFGTPGPIGSPGGIDLRRTAIIEADEPRDLRLGLGPAPATESEESVTIRRHNPTEVVIEVELASAGLVVLADFDAVGWWLELDGSPATILRANHAMRAAVVSAGTHRLVYRYEPASLRIGLAISAASLLATIGLVAIGRSRRQPAPDSEPRSA